METWKLEPWKEEFSQRVCSWNYEKPYDVYNLPGLEEMKEKGIGFCNPEKQKNFTAVTMGDELIGFFNLLEEEKECFLGVGLNPKWCSRGFGKEVLRMAVEESRRRYGKKGIYLDVRDWNVRAVKCYEKAGFRKREEIQEETYAGKGKFLRMEYVGKEL